MMFDRGMRTGMQSIAFVVAFVRGMHLRRRVNLTTLKFSYARPPSQQRPC